MSPTAVQTITFLLAGVVFGLYVWFIAWRVRVDRKKKAAATTTGTAPMSPSIARALQLDDPFVDFRQPDGTLRSPSDSPSGASEQESASNLPFLLAAPEGVGAPVAPAAADGTGPAALDGDLVAASTVLDAVAGISVPNDLAPHPDAAPHPEARDRVTLITGVAGAAEVREGMTGALEALGYQLVWDGDEAAARRGPTLLRVSVCDRPGIAELGGRPAYPVAPPGSVIVDLWLPV